jgi:aminopeptidase
MFDTDKRWKELGKVFVDTCLELKPGEKLMIAQYEPETWPLALATYEAAIQSGGYPQIQLKSEYLRRAFMKYGSEEQYSWLPGLEALGMEWADAYVALRGGYNLDIYHDIPAEVLAANQAVQGKISTLRWQHTRWLLSRVPNAAFAQQAGLDLETVTNMYFDATLMDYGDGLKEWEGWAKAISGTGKQVVHVTGKKTDLTMEVIANTWQASAVIRNIPGGEIFCAPDNNKKLNGTIYWENPGVLGGRLMPDMQVTWKDGVLIKATASKNGDYLNNVLASDAGASLLGEFAFGTNRYLTHFTNDILWDEKIYGTIHFAFGRSAFGGTNQSAIHWDVVKDMREEGEVTIDGVTVMRDGELLLKDLTV